jgi:ATP-binding cassette, subfamily A (ABC1), member 3
MNGTNSFMSPDTVMARVIRDFSPVQARSVIRASSPATVPNACPQNFNLFSECFAAVVFNYLPTSAEDTAPINYTIRADGGLYHIDVKGGKSDYEKRILPLQLAVDQVR